MRLPGAALALHAALSLVVLFPGYISAVPLESEDNNQLSLPPTASIDNSSFPLSPLLKRSPVDPSKEPPKPAATRDQPERDEDGYLRPDPPPRTGTAYENVRPIHPGTRPRHPSPTQSFRRPRVRYLAEPQRPSRLRCMVAFFHGLISPNQGRPWSQSSRQRPGHREDAGGSPLLRSRPQFPDELQLPGYETHIRLDPEGEERESDIRQPADGASGLRRPATLPPSLPLPPASPQPPPLPPPKMRPRPQPRPRPEPSAPSLEDMDGSASSELGNEDKDNVRLPPPPVRSRPVVSREDEPGFQTHAIVSPINKGGSSSSSRRKEEGEAPVKLKTWPASIPTGNRPKGWPRISTDREDDPLPGEGWTVPLQPDTPDTPVTRPVPGMETHVPYRFTDGEGHIHWSPSAPREGFGVLLTDDATDPSSLFPQPSISRLLPAPLPTGYSSEGVPLYRHWIHPRDRLDWMYNNPGDRQQHRPFQLIPKAGGCYSPPRGAIGSTEGFCGGDSSKDIERGYLPVLRRFPGAPGSGWHFAPSSGSSSSSSGSSSSSSSREAIAGPSAPQRDEPGTSLGVQGGRGGGGGGSSRWIAFASLPLALQVQAQAINQALENLHGSTSELLGNLLNDILTYVSCFVEFRDCPTGSIGVLVVTYMPHLVESLLIMLHSTPGTSLSKMSKGRHGKRGATSASTDWLSEGFCSRFKNCQMGVPEDFQTSLYLDCAHSTADDPVDRSLNMFSRKAVCDAFTKAENRTGMLPAIDIDCTWDRDPVKQHPSVYMCNNNDFQQPCTTVEARLGQCVDVPKDFARQITSLLPNGAAGDCYFYTDPGCKGGKFQSSFPGHDLFKTYEEHLSVFNDAIQSFRCSEPTAESPDPTTTAMTTTTKRPSGLRRWEWSVQTQRKICTHFDELSFGIQLKDGTSEGTFDTLKLQFVNEGWHLHTIVESPGAGYHQWQRIDLENIFHVKSVDINRIRLIRIRDRSTNVLFGGDEWGLIGLKFRARCAKSGIFVEHNKFASLNKELQIHSTHGGDIWTGWDYQAWEGYVNPEDWEAKPPCSHFDRLNVKFEIENRNWAGTNNDVYLGVGDGRFLLAHEPSVNEVFPLAVDLRKAFGKASVAFEDLKSVKIASQGGHDQMLPKSIRLEAFCAGSKTMGARQEKDIEEWIADGGEWKMNLHHEDWNVIST
ncbi:hypothetical protein CP532_1584 [Ophiocordyceps camponoti-leonardi (nom. inval.)]|nr:hypothetical protein CP532_1584 [Ophiocordyceps camponoti-leonardi (nom. inval.)]